MREPLAPEIAQGAARYAAQMGQRRRGNYGGIVIAPQAQEGLARAYDAAPSFDRRAVPAFRALREETGRQFDFLTRNRNQGGLGVDVSTQHTDPYANTGEMVRDLASNRRMAVLSTQSTGGHPFFSNDENDMFRAVHDTFGHGATGRAFDRHGEEAAYQSHASMFSPLARQALATETRGQNAHLIRRGSFAEQKVALLPGATGRLRVPSAHRPALLAQAQQFHLQHGLT